MDRLAQRLREDARDIEVTISPELESRLQASLHGIAEQRQKSGRTAVESWRFHLKAALTGAGVAAVLLAAINLGMREPEVFVTEPDLAAIELPAVPWRVEPAVLTTALEEEYADLRSDLRKAEEAVRAELEAVF